MSGIRRLGDVADVLSGVGFPRDLQGQTNGDVPVFKVGDISNAVKSGTRYLRASPNYLSKDVARKLSATLMPAGTTVFAKIGEGLKLNRRAILGQPSLVDNNVMGLVPKPGLVSSGYLYYFMQTVDLGELSRATAVPSVRKSDVVEVSIPVPTVARQDEIVAEIERQFSRLDEAVANLRRAKVNLTRHRAALLRSALQGGLVPTEAEVARRVGCSCDDAQALLRQVLQQRRVDFSGRGKYKEPAAAQTPNSENLPSGWVWATVEQLTNLVTSGSRGWGDLYSYEGVLFIRAQDIKTDELRVETVARVNVPLDSEGSRSSVGVGDILVTITGANVTKSARVNALGEQAFVSQHVALLKFVMPELSAFAFLWIVSPSNGRNILEKWAYGAGKPGLSLEQVRALPIALPPLAEQHRIVAEVDRRLSIVREVEAQVDANLKRARALRQAVLAKAFTAHP